MVMLPLTGIDQGFTTAHYVSSELWREQTWVQLPSPPQGPNFASSSVIKQEK